MVAIGPADYFKEETDDENEPEDDGFLRPRAQATDSKTPVKGKPKEAAGAESTEAATSGPEEPEEPATEEPEMPASRPLRDRNMRPLTAVECARLGPYRMMTAEERATAPPFKEMSPNMAKTHVLPPAVFAYQQECKHEAKELKDYRDTCRTIFTRLLALLPEAAVDTMKARAGWATIYANRDIPGLRNAATQAISNTNSRLYTAL